jgi:hypothetical protein
LLNLKKNRTVERISHPKTLIVRYAVRFGEVPTRWVNTSNDYRWIPTIELVGGDVYLEARNLCPSMGAFAVLSVGELANFRLRNSADFVKMPTQKVSGPSATTLREIVESRR